MIVVYKDEADGLWTWACHPAKRYLTEHDAYVAAAAAHPDQIIRVEHRDATGDTP